MSEEIRLPFQNTPEEEREKSQDEQFWTHIEELLEQIEENTRAGFARRLMPAATETPPRKGSEAVPKNTALTSKARAQEKTAPYRSIRAEKQPAPSILHPAAPLQAKPAGGPGKKHSEKAQNPTAPEKQAGKIQGRGHDGVPSSSMASKQKDANAASSAPTKSQEALAQRRQEAISQKQSKGILGALKDNLASWDGSIADKSGVQEAAGLAAGGPLWSAFKELREAIPTGDDADESSLAGILKKTIAQKTGITAAKERVDQAAQTARAKVVAWAGGKVDAPKRGNRDKQGRFIKGAGKEAKVAEKSFALASQEAREGKKRHDELIEAIKDGARNSGGGIFGDGGLVDRMGRRRGARKAGAAKPGRTPGRRGRFGLLAGAGATLMGGAAALSGDPVSTALDVGTAAISAPGAGKVAGGAGKALGLGAKGALGAAKAIPIAGQVLAAGMALYDGVSGWNDADMHREAFGLEEGQEASTGQKVSASAANILDMGGLLTGAAGLLGFEVSTADIAKGLFDIGDSIGSTVADAWAGVTSLFSSGESREKESAGQFDELTGAISDLTDTIDEDIKKKEKPGILATAGGFFSRLFGGDEGRSASGSTSTGQRTGGAAKVASAASYSGLGDVVAMSETGGKGTAMISSGKGDHGGVSYGRSQLASKVGSINAALKWAKENGYEDIHDQLAPLAGDATDRNGQFAQKWRELSQEKGGRLEQFDKAYQKKGYYEPMMAKIRRQNPELAKRIEANPALQEQVLSTAVQYGPNSGRYLSAATEVLQRNPTATDRDLLMGVQDIKVRDVNQNFGSSSADVRAGVANRHGNTERQRLLAVQDRFERGEIKIAPATGTGEAVAKSFAKAPEAAVEATSQALQQGTQDAIDRGVRYQFGSKNSASGGIDCSGWVTENTRNMMEAVNAESGKPIYGKEAKAVLRQGANGGAAGLIQTVSQATGELLSNDALAPDKVREGMMIGMDTGNKGWDRGRFGGIDHIVQTYRDAETGRMMVSESSSRKGVTVTDYEEWYKKWNGRAKLYGTDVTKLADASLIPAQVETAVAEAATQQASEQEAVPAEKEQTLVASATPAMSPPPEVQAVAFQEAQPQVEQRFPDPEPIRPDPPAPPTKDNDFSQVVALLAQLVDVTKQNATDKERSTEDAGAPNIPMDYEDAYCLALAHDRA